MAKKIEIKNNYLLYFENESNVFPTSVFSRKNTIFNFSIDKGFELNESGDGRIFITILELNSGEIVNEKSEVFDVETFFDFLTQNTAMFGSSGENSKIIS
jgi:hypothetical protein